jgi:hypothetical protein
MRSIIIPKGQGPLADITSFLWQWSSTVHRTIRAISREVWVRSSVNEDFRWTACTVPWIQVWRTNWLLLPSASFHAVWLLHEPKVCICWTRWAA